MCLMQLNLYMVDRRQVIIEMEHLNMIFFPENGIGTWKIPISEELGEGG